MILLPSSVTRNITNDFAKPGRSIILLHLLVILLQAWRSVLYSPPRHALLWCYAAAGTTMEGEEAS